MRIRKSKRASTSDVSTTIGLARRSGYCQGRRVGGTLKREKIPRSNGGLMPAKLYTSNQARSAATAGPDGEEAETRRHRLTRSMPRASAIEVFHCSPKSISAAAGISAMPASGSGISRPVTMDTKGACGEVGGRTPKTFRKMSHETSELDRECSPGRRVAAGSIRPDRWLPRAFPSSRLRIALPQCPQVVLASFQSNLLNRDEGFANVLDATTFVGFSRTGNTGDARAGGLWPAPAPARTVQ